MTTKEKLEILSGAAKYDASCASSGSNRSVGKSGNGTGATMSCGVCHSWSDDGRCVSLLKLLYSNACVYDCAYCVNRRSNDIPRATFTVQEVVNLTTEFYKRNYIEGLFLSSGVVKNPDFTMERMIEVCRRLREEENFYGYIHLKLIPGASSELLDLAGRMADRVSVNIELPSADSLRQLAPDKHRDGILTPMKRVGGNIIENREERKKSRSLAPYAPAGQSTQMIIGATPESDYHILRLSESLYQKVALKRVYYSAYIPVNEHASIPAMSSPPLRREHRLYQADWLLRYYQFGAHELLDAGHPFLDPELDPKVNWALRHLQHFPVEINRADYATLLRIPGIGVTSARRIAQSRRWSALTFDHLRKIGVVLKRAAYFITCGGKMMTGDLLSRPEDLRGHLIYDLKPGEWKQPLLPGWSGHTAAIAHKPAVPPGLPVDTATPETTLPVPWPAG